MSILPYPIRNHPKEALLCGVVIAAAMLLALTPAVLALRDALCDPGEAIAALVDASLRSRIAETLLLCGAALICIIPLGTLLAWLLTRTDLPGRHVLMMLVPFPLFLPPLVHVLSWFSLTGLQGRPAIITVYVISFTPLSLLLAARACEQIGRDHHDMLRMVGGRGLVIRDELRQALPGAMIGGVLALVFMLFDFAVADFLTSVGPKVTVYADTLYAHHLGMRSAAASSAALPGIMLLLLALFWALRARRRLGAAAGNRFEPAPLLALRGAGYPLAALTALLIAAGSILPLAALILRTGSFTTFGEQAVIAWPRIRFTVFTGTVAATIMVLLALPLGMLAARLRRTWWLDLLLFLPLAVPPLLFGIGLTRLLNRPGLDAIYLGSGAVLIAMIGRSMAFAHLPISSAIERVDRAMTEAAAVAGAGVFARFRTIVLPLITGPAIVAWCVTYCLSLRELDTLIMLRAGQQSLSFHLYSNVVFARQDEIAAIALLLAAITCAPLLLYLACARRTLRFL